MKTYMITWEDNSISMVIAKSMGDAKYLFDMVGDVSSSLSIVIVNLDGMVIDIWRDNLKVELYSEYVKDEKFNEAFTKMVKNSDDYDDYNIDGDLI